MIVSMIIKSFLFSLGIVPLTMATWVIDKAEIHSCSQQVVAAVGDK